MPTIQGYKIYIDDIKENSNNDIKDQNHLRFRNKHLGIILDNINEMLSKLSGVMAVSLEPSVENHRLRKVELIWINPKKAFVVCVTDLGIVKTANLNLFNYTSCEVLEKVSEFVNLYIENSSYNYSIEDLKDFLEKVGELDEGLSNKNDCKINISNKTSLLLYSDDLQETISFLESDDNIKSIFKVFVKDTKYIPYDINILFGSDLEIPELQNYSLIFTIYEYENERGVVGIIGPNRMDYKENIEIFKYITNILKYCVNSNRMLKIEG